MQFNTCSLDSMAIILTHLPVTSEGHSISFHDKPIITKINDLFQKSKAALMLEQSPKWTSLRTLDISWLVMHLRGGVSVLSE